MINVNVHDCVNVFFFRKNNSNEWFIGFEEHLLNYKKNESIVKLGNFKGGGIF